MNVSLPDRVETQLDPRQVQLDLAVGMYSSVRVTLGTAAEVAGLSVPEFQRELGRRRIPINYTAEDLAYDVRAAAELAGR